MSAAGRPSTLLGRLSRRLALVMAFAFALQTGLVVWEYGRDREELARSAVTLDLDTIVSALHPTPTGFRLDPPEAFDDRYRLLPQAYGFEVVAVDGTVLLERNRELFVDAPFDPRLPLDTTWYVDRVGETTRRVLSRRIEASGVPLSVRVGFRDDPAGVWRQVLITELTDHVAGPLTPLTILVLAVVLWVVRRSLDPLGRAAAVAAGVDPRQTRFRLGEKLAGHEPPAEVIDLAEALDKLLDRIDAVTQAQASFAGTIAHELRTPLSLLSLELEGVPGEAAARARNDVQAMARSVEQLLGIARLDALQLAPDARVDLAAVAGATVGRLAPLAITAGRDLAFVDAGASVVAGHAEAVTGALRNLVENALRVTPAGTTVTVTAGPGPRLSVEDEGPGLPPGGAAPLFARFVQGDRAEGGSAGLGLAIVAKTMEVHGGRVATADRPNGGARFTLIFPKIERREA